MVGKKTCTDVSTAIAFFTDEGGLFWRSFFLAGCLKSFARMTADDLEDKIRKLAFRILDTRTYA